jgi:hypothetical protein
MPDDITSKQALLHHQSDEYPELKGNLMALITLWEDTVNSKRMDSVFTEFDQMLASEER